MRIVIVGAGRMGFSLAQELDREGQEVSVVDPRLDRVELAQTRLDVMAVAGSGCSRASLVEARGENADLLLAVSGSDEVNIVSCLIGRELGIARRVARIESRALLADINGLEDVMGVDEYVSPKLVTLDRLHRILTVPGITESADFAGGRIILRAFRVDEPSVLHDTPLSEVRGLFESPFLVAAVRRGDELVVPKGDFRILAGDIIYAVMPAEVVDAFLRRFGLGGSKRRRVFVHGAGDIGMDLCAVLAEGDHDPILIENDPAACETAAEMLRDVSIVRGSPLDMDLMQDLGIEDASFVSVTGSAEVNFSTAVLAKRRGARRAIMLAGQPEEAQAFDMPPLDAVVSPISLSVGAVLRSVRAGRVLSLFKLAGTRGEALEIEAMEGAPGTGVPLKDVDFPSGAVVAAVTGGDEPRVAGGDTVIAPGEHAVVVALDETVHEAIRLFTRS